MSPLPDDVRELVGADVPPDELALLRQADAALRATPAPPDVSETLDRRVLAIPGQRRRVGERRRLLAGLAIAAGFAGAAFGIGLWAGGNGSGGPSVVEEVTLAATANGPREAEMTLSVLELDAAGNWNMSGDVRGLPPLPDDGYYVLWLARDGEYAATCGTFDVATGTTTVRLTASYPLATFDEWVISAHADGPDDEPPWLLRAPTT